MTCFLKKFILTKLTYTILFSKVSYIIWVSSGYPVLNISSYYLLSLLLSLAHQTWPSFCCCRFMCWGRERVRPWEIGIAFDPSWKHFSSATVMTWFTAILENVKIAWDHSAIKTETDYTEKHQHIKYSAMARYSSQHV